MNKLLVIIALLALAISIFALATPNEVVVERTIIVVEKEAPVKAPELKVSEYLIAPIPASPLPATHRLHPPTTYHWAESESYRQWKNSVKTEDRYLPSHFGLGGSLSSSGHWERR